MFCLLIIKNLNRNLIFIGLAVFFEKILIFLISFVFVHFIKDEVFGLWILYFQLILIGYSIIFSPLEINFNINFFKNTDRPVIYNTKLIVSLLIAYSFFLQFYTNNITELILIIISICAFGFCNYILNYFRFENLNIKYLKFTFVKFLFFCFFLFMARNNITINHLLILFILSNILIIVLNFSKLSFSSRTLKSWNFLMLSIYGGITLIVSALDKLSFSKFNLSLEDLATLGYALSFCSIPVILLEVVKKYFTPIIFNDLNKNKSYSRIIVKKLSYSLIALTIFQFLFPFIVFLIFKKFNFLKISLITNDFLQIMMFLNIGLSIFNIYHFINPIFFYFEKSKYLSFILLISGLIYLTLNTILNTNSVLDFSVTKVYMYTFIVISTLFFLHFKKNKFN